MITHLAWPLNVDIVQPDASGAFTTTIRQAYNRADSSSHEGDDEPSSVVSNSGEWADDFPANTIQSGSQSYFSATSDGPCYSRSITATHGVLTSITDGRGCDDD